MSKPSSPVALSRVGDVGVLTMQFAPHNLVGGELCTALLQNIESATTQGFRALILKSGLRHFSAGADLALFENGGARLASELNATGVLNAFENAPMPIIASVHGVAIGGGFELALVCDLIVAGSSAKFGLVEATLGLHPLMGGIQRVIDRVGVARAKEIVMLGRRYDAATLERWGIVNRVVPDAQLDESTMSIAQELAAGPTIAHAATKRLANIFVSQGMRAADQAMKEIQVPIFASHDLARGLDAFRSKGPGNAVFEGN